MRMLNEQANKPSEQVEGACCVTRFCELLGLINRVSDFAAYSKTTIKDFLTLLIPVVSNLTLISLLPFASTQNTQNIPLLRCRVTVTSLKSLLEIPTVQGCPLLAKLPIDLRSMIYDHVFADRAEMRLPHPLMLVCKQIQAEPIDAATLIVGPRIQLCMGVNTKSVVHWVQYRFEEDEPLRYLQKARASGRPEWWGDHAFGRYFFGPQLSHCMRTIWIRWDPRIRCSRLYFDLDAYRLRSSRDPRVCSSRPEHA